MYDLKLRNGRSMGSVYYRTQEIAEAFQVSHATVRAWVKRGCPCVRLTKTGLMRFRLEDVQKWLDMTVMT